MPEKKKISLCAATFILIGVASNPGMVALMPFAYHLVGIGQAYLFTAFSLWIQCVAIYFIVSISLIQLISERNLKVHTYPELAAKQCGSRMKFVLSVLSCVALLGASVGATVFVSREAHP